VRDVAAAAVVRTGAASGRPGRRSAKLPAEVTVELERLVGARRAPRLAERLGVARTAFERERYDEARRILGPLAREAPGAAAVRELNGLALYRLGRWKQAATELGAYRRLTGAVDQHPVLADAYRALRQYTKVHELWEELRAASPSAALVAEGRIVAAGTRADQGDLDGAIALLERSTRRPRRHQEHHLRLWYALADLYDRAGDTTAARRLFAQIRAARPGFADVEERLAALD
jgi:tetratricopeptide (TPR) repeat protein